jgi:hypothetical protein
LAIFTLKFSVTLTWPVWSTSLFLTSRSTSREGSFGPLRRTHKLRTGGLKNFSWMD